MRNAVLRTVVDEWWTLIGRDLPVPPIVLAELEMAEAAVACLQAQENADAAIDEMDHTKPETIEAAEKAGEAYGEAHQRWEAARDAAAKLQSKQ